MSLNDLLRVHQLNQLGRWAEAKEAAQASLAQDPDNALILQQIAIAEDGLGNRNLALEHTERAVALQPDAPELLTQRAVLLSALGKHDDARQGFAAALSIDPENSFALRAEVEAILRDPKTKRRRGREGQFMRAERNVKSLIRNHPDTASAHIIDAKVKIARADNARGAAAARKALEIEPDNALAHELLGLANEASGDTHGASEAYVRAARADPTSSSGIENLRRLGKGTVAPIGIVGYIAIRAMSRAGRIDGVDAVWAGIVIAVLLIGGYVALRVSARNKATAQMNPEAQAILEQDKKFS